MKNVQLLFIAILGNSRYVGAFTNPGGSNNSTNGLPPDDPIVEAPSLNFTLSNRGFTGHEHYPELRIINMNGRLYDPVIGRFFSPDRYVQIPDFTQSFNRYSYCLNNPLHYTDPSGNIFQSLLNIITIPARLITEGVTWVNDKINGDTRHGGYFDPGYIFGQNAPGSLTPYNPVNTVSYGQPGYIPPGASFNGLNNSGLSYGSGWGLNVDNTIPERFEFEWYWAGGTIGKLRKKGNKEVGMIVPWGQWYTRIVKVGGEESALPESIANDRAPYSGFWGALNYIRTGGIENGIQYNYDGTVVGFAPRMGNAPVPSFKGGAIVKTLQTSGRTINSSTLKALNLTQEQGKKGIEALKKDWLLPNNAHFKIKADGSIINPNTGFNYGTIFDYLY